MFQITPISQRNPQWSGDKLGFGSRTIGLYGCTITCLTMLLNYLGYSETPKTVNLTLKTLGEYDPVKNPKGAFQGSLLVWGNVQRKYPKIRFVYRDWNYQNVKVWIWINVYPRLPVMVEVNAAKIGGLKHWVLFKGSQRCNDPWTGTEISTGYYIPLTGDALYNKV